MSPNPQVNLLHAEMAYKQKVMLREAGYFYWVGATGAARECLQEVAASIDNPNHVFPRWMRRVIARSREYDPQKIY